MPHVTPSHIIYKGTPAANIVMTAVLVSPPFNTGSGNVNLTMFELAGARNRQKRNQGISEVVRTASRKRSEVSGNQLRPGYDS